MTEERQPKIGKKELILDCFWLVTSVILEEVTSDCEGVVAT